MEIWNSLGRCVSLPEARVVFVLAEKQRFEGRESKPKGLGDKGRQHTGREVIDPHDTLEVRSPSPDVLDRIREEAQNIKARLVGCLVRSSKL